MSRKNKDWIVKIGLGIGFLTAVVLLILIVKYIILK